MLAIARILRTGARFLMLDEPTEGLAPVIIQQIGRTIHELKKAGFTILLVEQNFRLASTLADRFYVMEHGKIIDASPPPTFPRTWTSCMITWAYEGGRAAAGRHARACPGYPRSAASEFYQDNAHSPPAWMAGTSPAMTARAARNVSASRSLA